MTPEPRLVDVHAHAMPLEVLAWLDRHGLADLAEVAGGVVRLASEVSGLAPGAPIPFPPEQHDLERRLAAMDEAGVAVQAVSVPPYLFAADADERLTLDLARVSNDAVAALAAASGGRLVALGHAPVGRAGAIDEAVRCLDELGMAGLTIGTAGGGAELDDPVNVDLWDLIAERRSFTLLHPSRVSSPERLGAFHLVQLLGYPAETALAVGRLAFAGVLERAALPLCLAHGGGCLISVLARFDLGWQRKAVCRTVTRPPSDLVRGLLFDTAVFDGVQLRRLVDDVGADHVLLGTDFPFDLADRDPAATLAVLDDAERALIGGRNARRHLALPAGVSP